jgi:hypothetical protein
MRKLYEDVKIDKGTLTITARQPDFKQIVDRLHSSGVFIRAAYFKEPTLEDVFLNITGKELRV